MTLHLREEILESGDVSRRRAADYDMLRVCLTGVSRMRDSSIQHNKVLKAFLNSPSLLPHRRSGQASGMGLSGRSARRSATAYGTAAGRAAVDQADHRTL